MRSDGNFSVERSDGFIEIDGFVGKKKHNRGRDLEEVILPFVDFSKSFGCTKIVFIDKKLLYKNHYY